MFSFLYHKKYKRPKVKTLKNQKYFTGVTTDNNFSKNGL